MYNIQESHLNLSDKLIHTKRSSEDFPPYCCLDADASMSSRSDLVALDCEMVGVGVGRQSALARCSIVDYHGNVKLDCYVKPEKKITDYRTRYSGILPFHMKNAITFKEARTKVKRLLKKKYLVGHSIGNDLKILQLRHDPLKIRDTSRFPPLRLMAGLPISQTPSLKNLSKALFNKDIQSNVHCSVEDSRTTMNLYKLVEDKWELQGVSGSDRCYLDDVFWPDFINMN